MSTFPRFSSEQQSKAKMAAEIEELKRDYEDKLKEVTWHKMTLQTKAIQTNTTTSKTNTTKTRTGRRLTMKIHVLKRCSPLTTRWTREQRLLRNRGRCFGNSFSDDVLFHLRLHLHPYNHSEDWTPKVSSEGGTTVAVGVGDAVPVANPINPNNPNPATMVNGVVHGNVAETAVNQEQLKAMEK